jgi:hypothetical protein
VAAYQATPCFQVNDVPMANQILSGRLNGGWEALLRRGDVRPVP